MTINQEAVSRGKRLWYIKYIMKKLKKLEERFCIVDRQKQTQLKQLEKMKNEQSGKKENAYFLKGVSLKRQKKINLLRKREELNDSRECLNCIKKFFQGQELILENYVCGCPILVCTQFKLPLQSMQSTSENKQLFLLREQKFIEVIEEIFVKGINYKHCYAFLGLKHSETKTMSFQFRKRFKLKIKQMISCFDDSQSLQSDLKSEYSSYIVEGIILNQKIIQVFNKSYRFVLQNFIYPKEIIKSMDQIQSQISIDYIPVQSTNKENETQLFVIRMKFDLRKSCFDQLVYGGFEKMLQKNKQYIHFYELTNQKGKSIQQVKGKRLDFRQNYQAQIIYKSICSFRRKRYKEKNQQQSFLNSEKVCGHYSQRICEKVNENFVKFNKVKNVQTDQYRAQYGRMPMKSKKYQYVLLIPKQNLKFVQVLNVGIQKVSDQCKFQEIAEILLSKCPRSVYYLTTDMNFDKLKKYYQNVQKEYHPKKPKVHWQTLIMEPKKIVKLQNANDQEKALNIVLKHHNLIGEGVNKGTSSEFVPKWQKIVNYCFFECHNIKSAIIVMTVLECSGIKIYFQNFRKAENVQQFKSVCYQ